MNSTVPAMLGLGGVLDGISHTVAPTSSSPSPQASRAKPTCPLGTFASRSEEALDNITEAVSLFLEVASPDEIERRLALNLARAAESG